MATPVDLSQAYGRLNFTPGLSDILAERDNASRSQFGRGWTSASLGAEANSRYARANAAYRERYAAR